MNKRGQYYLIAAIIVVGLIMTFATVTNSIQKTSSKQGLYNLYNNANIDDKKAANFNLQTAGSGYSEEQMEIILYDLNNIYPGVEKNIYLVTVPLTSGDAEAHAFHYVKNSEIYGHVESMQSIISSIDTANEKVKVNLNNKIFYLDYNKDINNYFIIISEPEEQYIIKSSSEISAETSNCDECLSKPALCYGDVSDIDADEDNYFTSVPGTETCHQQPSFEIDCCDIANDNGISHPGTFEYHPNKNACGSYDYNCDGQEQMNTGDILCQGAGCTGQDTFTCVQAVSCDIEGSCSNGCPETSAGCRIDSIIPILPTGGMNCGQTFVQDPARSAFPSMSMSFCPNIKRRMNG